MSNIYFVQGTRSLNRREQPSAYVAFTMTQDDAVTREVSTVTAIWRDTTKAVAAQSAEISRMASTFEHHDLTRALEP